MTVLRRWKGGVKVKLCSLHYLHCIIFFTKFCRFSVMMEQMAGMVSCHVGFGSMEALGVVDQSLSYIPCNTSCKREAGRPFLLCTPFAFELSVRSSCFDISCGGHHVRVTR
jgi:hypothetical protein